MGSPFHKLLVVSAAVLSLLGAVASPVPAGAGSDPVAALADIWP